MASLERNLADILNEPLTSVIQRERSALGDILEAAKNKVVLCGAGNLGRSSLTCLQKIGIQPLAITDRNSKLWGSKIDGCPVLSLKQAAERYGSSAAFLVTIWNATHWYRVTQQELTRNGCLRIVPVSALYWRFAEEMLPFYCQDLPHSLYQEADQVMAAASLWSDNQSRKEYLSQVRWRALGNWHGLTAPEAEESYFPKSILRLQTDKAFVDCGAFEGDTIRAFLEHSGGDFESILAIEPHTLSFLKLTKYIGELATDIRARINPFHCAVGVRCGSVRFDDCAGAVTEAGGTSSVECVSLDNLLENTPASYIKMDIEGAEHDALTGARKTIARDRPVLAVCVYHRQADLWRLPLLIQEMAPDYLFYLRLHEGDGWQTVAYAVPRERARTS